MKNTLCLFALLLMLAACAPTVAIPTRTAVPATETPIPSSTVTQTPTETPTAAPTDTLAPTPEGSQFFITDKNPMPPSPDQAPMGVEADVAKTIPALHQGPSLLDAEAEPAFVRNMVNEKDGTKHFSIFCNGSGKINCSPAGLIQYKKTYNGQEYDAVVLILEMKTKDPGNGRGYLAEYIYGNDIPWLLRYNHWRQDPTSHWDIDITAVFAPEWQAIYPFQSSLTLDSQQPGFLTAVDTLISDDVTSQLETMVLP
jgi:hypothetical protein